MTATSEYLNKPVRTEREAQLEAENRLMKDREWPLQQALEQNAAAVERLQAENWRLKNACAGALERLSRVPIPSALPRMGDALAVSGAITVLRDALSTTASKGGE